MNKFDWLKNWADYKPDRIAVEEFETGKKFSYFDLNKYANQLCNWLADKYKLTTGDRIALVTENRAELIVLLGAAQKMGITLVPLNYRLTPTEINYVLSNCKPSLVIYEEQFAEKLKNTQTFAGIENKLLFGDFFRSIESSEEVIKKEYSFDEDHPVFIMYTSGTTAFPKGALYTHKMLFWNSINTEIRLEISAYDISISSTPPFHTGFWNVLFTPFLHHGAQTIITRKFDPLTIMKLIQERKVTLWWAVPTMLKMMSDLPEFNDYDLSSIRYMVVGGESMPIPVIETWHKKGVMIRQGYGLTEVGPNITSLSENDAIRKEGSIGTPNFYVDVKIVDESGNEIQGEGEGEFLLSGPNVTPGYWKNPDATKANIINGWFHTGDVVKRDADGFYFVVDRIKNMYISGGENVYPAQVEYQLRQHEGIDDVAIIGVPDEKWGETGKAFVVTKPNFELTEQKVQEFCCGKLAKFKIPKYVEFIDALPKNDSGKIDRKKLKRDNNE